MILYVDACARKDGDGSKDSPFRRIGQAAWIARPGDEILVSPGVYHEEVNPVHAGTQQKRITYRSTVPGQDIVFDTDYYGKSRKEALTAGPFANRCVR